jgi:hypothetical protein
MGLGIRGPDHTGSVPPGKEQTDSTQESHTLEINFMAGFDPSKRKAQVLTLKQVGGLMRPTPSVT